MKKIPFQADVPVKYEYDICVVGAGPGGIAAAVFAARSGCRVILLDAHTMAGGMSTAGRVPVFMPFSDGVNFLMPGFGREVLDALAEYRKEPDVVWSSAINAEHLKLIYEQMLAESGVKVLYYSRLAAVQTEEGMIRHALFAAPGGMFAVQSKLFIDGTGDGTLAAWAGAPFLRGGDHGEVMPSTLCSLWVNFDWEAYHAGGAFSHNDENMLRLLEQAFASGELPQEDYHLPGFTRLGTNFAGGNIGHAFEIDGTDEESLTAGLLLSRRLLADYERFYRKHIAGFANAEIVDSGSLLGVRESRRIQGEYILNRADYDARRCFPDEIGRYNYPADIHPPRTGREALEEHQRIFKNEGCKRGESYGIPYRILIPQKVENLLLCGRCVSMDRYVYASLRVIPGCYITGQAAGCAAALCLRSGVSPRQLDAQKLRAELRSRKALFPA